MNRNWKVDEKPLQDFLNLAGTLAVGATAPLPGVFPEDLGIGRREAPRNEFLGSVVTRPDQDKVVVGLNYFDAHDDGDNEDMYTIDVTTGELRPYSGRRFEKEYPEYAGHHRAKKDYLRKEPPST